MRKVSMILMLTVSLFACSKKSSIPAPPEPPDNGGGDPPASKVTLYPLPPVGYVGDVMPYYFNNEFHIFYLQDVRDGAIGYHPWDKFTTKDFLTYDYDGEMIPLGNVGDQDLAIGTGSIIKKGDTYYGYYTGHNWQFQGTGRAMQAVMLATSTDLEHWVKKTDFILKAPAGYDMDNFRDPLVVFNEENQEYMMLVGARINGKGVLAKFTTQDPATDIWEAKDPFYTQDEFEMLECPDIFKWGNNWYLTFFDTNPLRQTHYRMSTSMNGPWVKPANDVFDGEYFAAAKTVTDGQNRFIQAWIPTKVGYTDAGAREWGGTLGTHMMRQESDGTLSVTAPPSFTASFTKPVDLVRQRSQGDVTSGGGEYNVTSPDNLSFTSFNNLAGSYMITGSMSFTAAPNKCGFLFATATDVNKSFRIEYDKTRKGLVCENINYGSNVTDAFVPLELAANQEHQFKLFVEGSICVLYVDEKRALSTRIYGLQNNAWGVFGDRGSVRFNDLKLFRH